MIGRSSNDDVRQRRHRDAGLAVLALLLLWCWPAAAACAQDNPPAEPTVGKTLRITLPITGRTADRVRRFVRKVVERYPPDKSPLVLIFEFYVPPKQSQFGLGSEFGAAYELAKYLASEELSRIRTVAYVPQTVEGHAVLVAAACQEIYMAKDASIGLAGADERVIDEPCRLSYQKIANANKNIPAEVALWMLEPSHEVLVVPTTSGRRYVTPAGLEDLEKHHSIDKKKVRKLFAPDDATRSVVAVEGLISGAEASKERLFSKLYLADSREDVANALDLPSEDLEEDPGLVGEWKAVRVDLRGPMSEDRATQIEKLVEEQIRQGANFICLWIDSPGGSLPASQRLAYYLGSIDASKVRTRAYIPAQARADAALVALACSQVAMLPRAELGGPGARDFSDKEIADAREAIRAKDGPWKTHPWPLVAAMVDPKLSVFRCSRAGEVKYFSDDELQAEQRRNPNANWQIERVTTSGKPAWTGPEAVSYGLANLTVEDFAEFKRHYGLEEDPTLVEPGWITFLVEALTSRGVAAFLLMIGFVALYIELHMPGVGIGGFIATVCFALFFWSQYLGGTAGWLSVTLFVAGISCLLIEFFVLPGLAIFGLGGGILVLVSLVLASQTFVLPHNAYQWGELNRSLLTIAGAMAGFVAATVVLRKWLPRAPIVNQVLLEPPKGEEAETISRRESLVNLQGLLGERGTTTTQLTPSGKARFGDRLVDVITEGDLIPRGTDVEVVEVHGSRVLVKPVESG